MSHRRRQDADSAGFCGDPVSDAAHGKRAGGSGGSAAPAGAHETGARLAKKPRETASSGGRRYP